MHVLFHPPDFHMSGTDSAEKVSKETYVSSVHRNLRDEAVAHPSHCLDVARALVDCTQSHSSSALIDIPYVEEAVIDVAKTG